MINDDTTMSFKLVQRDIRLQISRPTCKVIAHRRWTQEKSRPIRQTNKNVL